MYNHSLLLVPITNLPYKYFSIYSPQMIYFKTVQYFDLELRGVWEMFYQTAEKPSINKHILLTRRDMKF